MFFTWTYFFSFDSEFQVHEHKTIVICTHVQVNNNMNNNLISNPHKFAFCITSYGVCKSSGQIKF